jgi:hypothetical protein
VVLDPAAALRTALKLADETELLWFAVRNEAFELRWSESERQLTTQRAAGELELGLGGLRAAVAQLEELLARQV